MDALTDTVLRVGELARDWLGFDRLPELQRPDELTAVMAGGRPTNPQVAQDLANALGCLKLDIDRDENELWEVLHQCEATGFAGWQAANNSGQARPHVLKFPRELQDLYGELKDDGRNEIWSMQGRHYVKWATPPHKEITAAERLREERRYYSRLQDEAQCSMRRVQEELDGLAEAADEVQGI